MGNWFPLFGPKEKTQAEKDFEAGKDVFRTKLDKFKRTGKARYAPTGEDLVKYGTWGDLGVYITTFANSAKRTLAQLQKVK